MTRALPSEVEFVVIGAGAAGVEAARSLLAAGREVQLLEAADYVGGRAITDHHSFRHPFDRGGAWLHSASINPLAPIAQQAGFTMLEDRPGEFDAVRIENRLLEEAEVSAYGEDFRRTLDLEVELPATAADEPLARQLPRCRWRDHVRCGIAMVASVDAERCSSVDFARFEDAPGEWLLAEGLGTLVAPLAERLPIQLNTPVRLIDWSGTGARVRTDSGPLRASKAIVTVASSVLHAGLIRFVPPLPPAKQEARSRAM